MKNNGLSINQGTLPTPFLKTSAWEIWKFFQMNDCYTSLLLPISENECFCYYSTTIQWLWGERWWGGEMILNGAVNLSFLSLFISFCILSTYHKILPFMLNAMIGRKSWFLSLRRKGGEHHSMILCASHFLQSNGNVYYMDPIPVLTLYADSKGGG